MRVTFKLVWFEQIKFHWRLAHLNLSLVTVQQKHGKTEESSRGKNGVSEMFVIVQAKKKKLDSNKK
jgi:hypothetical protein